MRLRGGLRVVIIITGPGMQNVSQAPSWFIAVVFRILCLLPESGVGEFWEELSNWRAAEIIYPNVAFSPRVWNLVK